VSSPPAPSPSAASDGGYGKGEPSKPTDVALVEEKKKSGLLVGFFLDSSLPLGSSSEFVDTFSFQGFSVDLRYIGFGNLGLGGMVAWHTIAEKSQRTLEWEGAALTGTMVTELSLTPILAKVSYALREVPEGAPPKQFVPYVATGLGASRLVRRLDAGISRIVDESWHFSLVPEVGVEVPVGPVAVLAAARFNYLFATDDAPEQLYMNFSLGVGLQ
jgi:hypothetical protein